MTEPVMREARQPIFQNEQITITTTEPKGAYDGFMFLADRPVVLDPQLVPVTEPVRYLGPDGLVMVAGYDPIPLQPNPLYQPTLPIIFK